ncbi:MAG: TatD family hydrolase [Chloroflexia bacterium]|nr:TatD family hydrolase [Chloroflexia bacterium]
MIDREALVEDAPGTPSFVDTHCHLDDESFDADLPDVLARSREAGVRRWINVGFGPDRWRGAIDLAARHPGMAFMLGVHPSEAEAWNTRVHQDLRQFMIQSPPVSVGEVGLDFYRGETNVDQQVRVFNAMLDLAIEHDIPATIHMRSSESLILDVLQSRTTVPPLVFHSFDGREALTDWILANGACVGVGGLATRTKSHDLQRELKRIPLDQIVLETDSPYLVPNGFKHRRNTPESITRIAAFLAGLREVAVADIAAQTTRNAERLFERLPPA